MSYRPPRGHFEVGRRRSVARQQVEQRQAARHRGGAGGIPATAHRGQQLAVGVARSGVAIAIQEFRVGGQRSNIIGAGLGGSRKRGARPLVSPVASIF